MATASSTIPCCPNGCEREDCSSLSEHDDVHDVVAGRFGPSHAIKPMIDGGLNVTFNSDDPGLIKTTLANEYARLMSEMRLSPRQIADMALPASGPPDSSFTGFHGAKPTEPVWQRVAAFHPVLAVAESGDAKARARGRRSDPAVAAITPCLRT